MCRNDPERMEVAAVVQCADGTGSDACAQVGEAGCVEGHLDYMSAAPRPSSRSTPVVQKPLGCELDTFLSADEADRIIQVVAVAGNFPRRRRCPGRSHVVHRVVRAQDLRRDPADARARAHRQRDARARAEKLSICRCSSAMSGSSTRPTTTRIRRRPRGPALSSYASERRRRGRRR